MVSLIHLMHNCLIYVFLDRSILNLSLLGHTYIIISYTCHLKFIYRHMLLQTIALVSFNLIPTDIFYTVKCIWGCLKLHEKGANGPLDPGKWFPYIHLATKTQMLILPHSLSPGQMVLLPHTFTTGGPNAIPTTSANPNDPNSTSQAATKPRTQNTISSAIIYPTSGNSTLC